MVLNGDVATVAKKKFTSYKEFFGAYGQIFVRKDHAPMGPTIEDTYQSFKARLKEEIEVFVGKLTDRIPDRQYSESVVEHECSTCEYNRHRASASCCQTCRHNSRFSDGWSPVEAQEHT